jgi:hypothetical protein
MSNTDALRPVTDAVFVTVIPFSVSAAGHPQVLLSLPPGTKHVRDLQMLRFEVRESSGTPLEHVILAGLERCGLATGTPQRLAGPLRHVIGRTYAYAAPLDDTRTPHPRIQVTRVTLSLAEALDLARTGELTDTMTAQVLALLALDLRTGELTA